MHSVNATSLAANAAGVAYYGYWETTAILVGMGMLLASDKSTIFWAQSKKEHKAGYTKAVSQATAPQAILLVGYFFLVSWVNGGAPSPLAGLGYLLLGFLIVCFLAGADAGNMSAEFSWKFRLAAAFRTPVLCFIVVPLSFAINAYRTLRTKFRGTRIDSEPSAHKDRVQQVVDAVAAWDEGGRKQKMRTARPNWAGMSTKLGSNKQNSHQIYTGHLNHILEVDEENMTITAEPAVNMGDITNLLCPRSLALVCQVEMESLTIGGLSMGLGMETNSHNDGWFQESVVAYEIVTAESPPQIRKITAESDPDVFYTLPHSVGTLGFLTAVTVKITHTKPFVRMHYIMTKSAEELTKTMTKLSEADNDKKKSGGVPTQFLEATVYSKQTAVVQTGEFCDAPTSAEEKAMVNGVNYWFKPFYFRHLESLLLAGHDTYDEIIPLKHYYHRFTRSIFWEIEDMIPFASHPLYRIFWGWMGAPEVSLLKLFQGPVIRKSSVYAHVVQESCMPVRRLTEGLDKFEQWWDIYPLLLFPLRVYDRGEHNGFLTMQKRNLAPGYDPKAAREVSRTPWGIVVDLAAYGVPRSVRNGGTFDAKKTVREFEHWTRDIGGFQCYYTDIFCTRREYRQMFNHTLWDKARPKLMASNAFPEPWDKVKSEPGIVDLSDIEDAERAEAANK
jgi:delta24-sterol reductase